MKIRTLCGVLVACVAAAASTVQAAVTIQDVRLVEYRIPRTKAFVTSKGTSDSCYGIFILLNARADDGKQFTALGDVLPRGLVTNETVKDAWAGAQKMAEFLAGRQLAGTDSAADAQAIRSWMVELDHIAAAQKLTTAKPPAADKQLRATLCGFDIALLDLTSQIHKVPVYELLGGEKRKSVSVSAETFNADASMEEIEDRADNAAESYGGVRLKIGTEDDKDVEKLRAVAKGIKGKSDVVIWVDVNQAWKSAEKSIAMLTRIRQALTESDFKATFICEQPTKEEDMPALAAVTAEVHTWKKDLPFKLIIMADEAVWTLADAKKMVELHAADMVNIKIQKAGGLMASQDIGNYLAGSAPDIGVYVGSLVATDVTSWANLQLCYALPRLDYATGCIPRRAYKINAASVPIEYAQQKTLKHPSSPGLGTGLNLDQLKGYIRNDVTISSARSASEN